MPVGVLKKVLWAVDVFEGHQNNYDNAASAIQEFVGRTDCIVYPVYVLVEEQLRLEGKNQGHSIVPYQMAAERALRGLLKPYRIKRVAPAIVLTHHATRSISVEEFLAHYALSVNADLMVVTSHKKTRWERLLLGSFSEALLVYSKVPVLIIGPEVKHVHSFERILFASRLQFRSRSLFRKIIRIAQVFKSTVILFHTVAHPIDSLIQSGVYLLGGGSWVPSHNYFGNDIDRQTRQAEAWAIWARHQGVPTEYVIDSLGGPVVKSILTVAEKENVGLIVMERRAGPMESVLLGSITKEVIRSASYPVWIKAA